MENSCHEDLQEVVDEGADESKAKRDKTDCSHRVIEKRRRDRINNSLMQLSKLVPVDKFNKKNSGKLEKAEILEVTVQYLTEQQQQQQQQQQKKQEQQLEQNGNPGQTSHEGSEDAAAAAENTLQLFLRGFKTCIVDATKFFQEVEELDVSEGRCHRLIQHLKQREHRYESKGEIPVKDSGDDRVWEGGDSSKDYTLRRSSELPVAGQPSAIVKCENLKRKKEDKEITTPKKPRMNPPAANGSESHPPGEQDLSSPANFSNDVSQSNTDSSNAMRNFMPFLLPNVPFFPTFPFTGTNGVPRYQAPQAQFPGYSFPQSATSYIPVALPQFPYMGMNFMSGFGMVNNDQQQNNGMASTMSSMTSGLPNAMVNGMPNAVPNAMPNGVNGGFFPSMYSNGIHANIMAMRPRDSGYESSDRSSSKESRSETSPPSFSDDSCQSFIT